MRRHPFILPEQTGAKLPSIRPFKGVVYNKEKIKDPSLVVSPPYDIISKEMQDELYRKSPYNFVRVDLNKITASDDAGNNRYIRSMTILESWIRDEILVKNLKEALYIYSQEYKEGALVKKRIGFIGLMSVKDKGRDRVLPHENTLAAPKSDRLNLIRKLKANLSPIFVLYEDAGHKIARILKKASAKDRPFIDIEMEGVRNRVWRLDDEADIKKIEDAMAGKDIFIADGHHRYETSRNYCAEIQNDPDASEELKEASKYIMAYFVESDEKMLTILPAHRVIKDARSLKKEDIAGRLKKYFLIEKAPGLKRLMAMLREARGKHVFGMYAGKKEFYILKLKSDKEPDKAIKDKPKAWKMLDVSILHFFIFQHLLGLRDEDDNIEFIKEPEDAVMLVDKREGEIAFFLNPTKVSQVKNIARLGGRMPRKATYFYPKPLSGLVIYKLVG